jgi:hypothetical protein
MREPIYFLMDLERTLQSGIPCFWKGNKFGYTYNLKFAGLFPEGIAEEIVKNDHDRKTVKIPLDLVKDVLGGEFTHESD